MPTRNHVVTTIAAAIVIVALAVILMVALRVAPPIPVDEAPIVAPEPSDTKDLFSPIVFYEAATPPTAFAYGESEDWAVFSSPQETGVNIAVPKIMPWKVQEQENDHTIFEADLDGEGTIGPIFMAIVSDAEPNARDGYWGDIVSALTLSDDACSGLPNNDSTDWRLRWVKECTTFVNAQDQLVIHLSGDWEGFRDYPAWINVYVMPSEKEGGVAAVLSDERFMDEQALEYFAAQGGKDVAWLRNMVRTMAESFSFEITSNGQ